MGNSDTVKKAIEEGLVVKEDTTPLVTSEDALIVLASATDQIANFLTGGGLLKVLNGYAKAQAVKEILGGLATHDGRNSLDARTIKQNALEIVEMVEAVMSKYSERLSDKEPRDPEIHNAVETDPGRHPIGEPKE